MTLFVQHFLPFNSPRISISPRHYFLSLRPFIFCQRATTTTSGFINGPSSSVSCSSASSTQSKYLHNVQLCVPHHTTLALPPAACIYVCNLWVANGRQQHLACLMFTLQNAITETAAAAAAAANQTAGHQARPRP